MINSFLVGIRLFPGDLLLKARVGTRSALTKLQSFI
jgi:hypothetical protein